MRARVPRVDYVNGRTLDTIDLTTALICVSTQTSSVGKQWAPREEDVADYCVFSVCNV